MALYTLRMRHTSRPGKSERRIPENIHIKQSGSDTFPSALPPLDAGRIPDKTLAHSLRHYRWQ